MLLLHRAVGESKIMFCSEEYVGTAVKKKDENFKVFLSSFKTKWTPHAKTPVMPPRGTPWKLGSIRAQAKSQGISELTGAPEVKDSPA